jgi:MoaA/NifB/PqqE/SkfB family radical SAM enzyme
MSGGAAGAAPAVPGPLGPTGGRGIFQIHPSRRCNLRCRHCYSESGPDVDQSLPVDVICGVVEQAADAGYEVLGVSGGEPLLYTGLLDTLRAGKSREMTTTVTTNGMLLTTRRLKELNGLVDVLAISLDGTPASHEKMRGDPRAFRMMAGRLTAVADSGIPFGFVFTLTQENVHELEWVTQFATEVGASLVQVHPLELEGSARTTMPDMVPDAVEMAFAAVEAMRLRSSSETFIQIDVATRHDMLASPERFLAISAAPDLPLGRWLTPLVLEADGTLVPFTFGFPRQFALGNVTLASLPEIADAWDPGRVLELARSALAEQLRAGGPPVVNWYQEITSAARAAAPATPAWNPQPTSAIDLTG